MAILFECTEEGHFGSPGDNKVRVTGGVEVTPATFAGFVTADRAGAATLLAATSCAKDMTLTYPIRPVELRALQISFVIAAKTAEKDYIWVTGTDAWGTALSEAIDILAGNGTYTSTQYFATITDIDVEDVGDGSGTAAADGTLAVTQGQWGLIWDRGDDSYTVDLTQLDIGNSGTSTYFTSLNEYVNFAGSGACTVLAAATLQIGALSGDWGVDGSTWHLAGSGNDLLWLNGGTLLIYASKIYGKNATQVDFWDGTLRVKNSLLASTYGDLGSDWQRRFQWATGLDTFEMEDVYLSRMQTMLLNVAPDTFENIHVHTTAQGITATVASVAFTGGLITNAGSNDIAVNGNPADVTWTDPDAAPDTPVIVGNEANTLVSQYSCNIQVVDRDGAAIQSATVVCDDQADAEIFSVSTDASGDIAEQTIPYKTWTGTSETLVTHSPHVFTISKAGYETLILPAITVDSPIVWHLELQSQRAPKGPRRHNV